MHDNSIDDLLRMYRGTELHNLEDDIIELYWRGDIDLDYIIENTKRKSATNNAQKHPFKAEKHLGIANHPKTEKVDSTHPKRSQGA